MTDRDRETLRKLCRDLAIVFAILLVVAIAREVMQ